MRKYRAGLLLLFCLFLQGCMFQSGDELLQAPKPPNDYLELSQMLDQILVEDVAYASPVSGQHRNPVQLIDIDSDGTEEAISFFRKSPTLGEFTIYLHKQMNGEYVEMGTITGDGTEIDSVHYPKFYANGGRGIILCWELGIGGTKGMTVASFTENGTVKTLANTEYMDFTYTDLDADGIDEIVTIVSDTASGKLRARIFDFDGTELKMLGEVALSEEAESVFDIHYGHVTTTTQAVYVESRVKDRTGLITDVLAIPNSTFINITLDKGDDSSSNTYRSISVVSADKNGNNIYEIPKLIIMPGYENVTEGEILYYIEWYEYELDGSSERTFTTYQNTSEEWQIVVPEVWKENVTAIRRRDGMQIYTSFEVYNENGENIPIAEIYAFTGDDKVYMSTRPGHFPLGATETVTYTAVIPTEAQNNPFAMSDGEIAANFSMLQTSFMY